EEVVLSTTPRARHHWRCPECLLEREQAFEHADRCMEGGAHGAALRLAVPPAVRQLLAQQAIDEPVAALAEVCAQRDDATVDALLDFALEERRLSELWSPRDVRANEIDRGSRRCARRIQSEVTQEQQRVHVRPPERRGGAVAPLAVGSLLIEQASTPSLM